MSVPSQWPSTLPTPIAFVGEAPSHEEVQDGKPFVGPSGRIFNSLLRTAGLSRDDYFITNVFDEKIPDNKIKNWCVPLKQARELGISALKQPIGANGYLAFEHWHHLDRLARELERAQPNVIVPLGGTALWAFSGATNISSMRGTAFPAKLLVPGTKIVPTYHPAFLMKKWGMYSVVVRDLQFAKAEADKGKELEYANRTLILEPTLADIRSIVDSCCNSSLLSVDIETGWGQITCIGFAWDSEHAICIPFIDQRSPNKSYWSSPAEEAEAWRLVRTILASDAPKLGQNFGGYDFMWLLWRYRLAVKNLAHDTRLLSHAIYPELPKDLGFLGASYASQGAWKHMGKRGDKRDDKQQ